MIIARLRDIVRTIENTTHGKLFLFFQMKSDVYKHGDFRNLSWVKENVTGYKNAEETET